MGDCMDLDLDEVNMELQQLAQAYYDEIVEAQYDDMLGDLAAWITESTWSIEFSEPDEGRWHWEL